MFIEIVGWLAICVFAVYSLGMLIVAYRMENFDTHFTKVQWVIWGIFCILWICLVLFLFSTSPFTLVVS